jgi:hypothetical protein
VPAHLYTFHSTWNLAAPQSKVWQTLTTTPFDWDKWWPELKDVRNMRLVKGLSGTTFSCTWQSPTGYRLKSDITIGEIVDKRQVTLQAEGDLRGTVTCQLSEPSAGHTRIEIDWRVQTTKRWMNYLTPLLKPVFIYNHHAVMRSGEQGLQNYLLR